MPKISQSSLPANSKRAQQEIPMESFANPQELRAWLRQNQARSEGMWMRIYKKGAGVETVTYAQALDVALCFGWIDGQKKPFDGKSWLQRFTPRRPRSNWSKKNTEHDERLMKSGNMTPAGLKEIHAAKADGRWQAAYDSSSNSRLSEDFLKELAKNKKAKAFLDTLNKTNLYSIAYRLQTAKKPETRERRKKTIIEMLAKGEKFH